MTDHTLKTWPEYYDAIERGEKTFEVRRDDRGFEVGDTLILQRTNPVLLHEVDADADGKARYDLRRRVSYVLRGGQFGVEAGFVVLALSE